MKVYVYESKYKDDQSRFMLGITNLQLVFKEKSKEALEQRQQFQIVNPKKG